MVPRNLSSKKISAPLKAASERLLIVQITLNNLDSFLFPRLTFVWISGNSSNFLAGFFTVDFGDGASLYS